MGTIIKVNKINSAPYIDFIYSHDSWEYKIWDEEICFIYQPNKNLMNYEEEINKAFLSYTRLFEFETEDLIV